MKKVAMKDFIVSAVGSAVFLISSVGAIIRDSASKVLGESSVKLNIDSAFIIAVIGAIGAVSKAFYSLYRRSIETASRLAVLEAGKTQWEEQEKELRARLKEQADQLNRQSEQIAKQELQIAQLLNELQHVERRGVERNERDSQRFNPPSMQQD
jgi:seryl-tRNA synthetase